MNTGHIVQDSIWRKPSAWLPVLFSIAALAVVLTALAVNGGLPHQSDEGTAAHLWQMFIFCDALAIGYFLLKWVAVAPRQALPVFGLQIAATLAAIAPVFFLHL